MILNPRVPETGRRVLVVAIAVVIGLGGDLACVAATQTPATQSAAPPAKKATPPAVKAAAQNESAKITPDRLDSLVAPIALYPDPLLAQVLAASTYPLEIVQLQQWLGKHKDLKEKDLADAVKREKWDPSIQGMAALPDVGKLLAEKN